MSHDPTDHDRAPSQARRASFGIIVSIATAVIFSLAFRNLAIGIAIGLILGGVGGAGLGNVTNPFRRRPDHSDDGGDNGGTA